MLMIITKVQQPAKLPSMDTLLACRSGLTKKIKRADKLEKRRLKDIREEIDFLIETL
jgi:hypothetical protein